jgi:RNA polymerase sigma-70 factor, ECF subfamily
VLLEEQDRSLWDHEEIAEGLELLRGLPPGTHSLQAAIAAEHARSPTAASTDWPRIAELYGMLAYISPTPVVELNRAVAVAMAEGPDRGLELIEEIEGLDNYHLLHSARGNLLRRLGRHAEAADAYNTALELASQPAERGFLEERLAEAWDSD